MEITEKKQLSFNFLDRGYTDTIKGVCIILILLSHIFYWYFSSHIIIRYILQCFAAVSCGIFLFLSGYGNVFSIQNKKNSLKSSFFKKSIRLYLVLFISTIPFYCLLWLLNSTYIYKGIPFFYNMLLLSNSTYGGINCYWYLKYQLLCYLFLYGALYFAKRFYLLILFISTAIFMFLTIKAGASAMWYVSAICFPIGCFCAEYRDKIVLHCKKYFYLIYVFVLLFIILMVIKGYLAVTLMNILGCLIIILFSVYKNIKIKPLQFMSKYTLELYVIHQLVMLSLKYTIKFSYPVKAIIVFVFSIILSMAVSKIINLIFQIRGKKYA